MQSLIELSHDLRSIFEGLGESGENELKRVLKAGFKEGFEAGKFGDSSSYPLEKDAMVWEDLIKEKQIRLESIRKLERLS